MSSVGSRLEAALRRDIAAWSKLHGIPVAVHCNGLLGAELSEVVGATVDYIVTEGLRNVAFHATASRCSVYVRSDAGALRVLVEDDGVGFSAPATLTDGGLARIRARTEAIGGSFLLETKRGKGTAVGMEVSL
jgi:signal transduction histidine kinase